ncbi:MAG: hypothetical protein MUE70_03785, partial [Desulfobacterales bacterium]|nr:hypothetical protein [Desulfobacterales bacterium]
MMNHKICIVACSMFAIFYCAPANAVLYKYTDSKGIVHITDKIATVPSKYKPQIVKDEKVAAGKEKKPLPPASESSAPDQKAASSEFQPAPAPAAAVSEKPVVSEFSLTSPEGKDVVEEPVESAKIKSPEKPSEFQPAPVAVKEPEKPAASEFSAPTTRD